MRARGCTHVYLHIHVCVLARVCTCMRSHMQHATKTSSLSGSMYAHVLVEISSLSRILPHAALARSLVHARTERIRLFPRAWNNMRDRWPTATRPWWFFDDTERKAGRSIHIAAPPLSVSFLMVDTLGRIHLYNLWLINDCFIRIIKILSSFCIKNEIKYLI